MPAYTLRYFNFRGRAELPRLMFAEAGCAYVDERISFEDWPKEKAKTPFGQLPVLMIDGKPLAQTGAIVRYLADVLDLAPKDELLKAYCDMILETLGGVFDKLPFLEKDETKKADLMKEAFEKHLCPTFAKFEKKFAEEKKEFLIGQKLTYIDLAMMNSLLNLEEMKSGFMNNYPALKALYNRVQNRPNIKKWIEKRPQTKF